ncbi:MAG: hypothetical protein RR548_09670 [Carnobacterium sp.]|uniref:hypothetical protein n=1 Tax=Carnobacterium sp. TaxID=48221 RepID=UPI002FCA17C9
MANFTYQRFQAFFNHSLFIIFATPLTYLFVGTLYAAQITRVHFLPFFLLYCFILLNQFLEKFLERWVKKTSRHSTIFLLIFELLNLSLVVYFTFSLHYLIGMLLLFYSLLVHGQFYLIKIGLAWFSIAMQAVFKGAIMTYISFSIQVLFIPNTLFLWSIPLVLLALFVELGKYQTSLKPLVSVTTNELFTDRTTYLALNSVLVLLYFSSFLMLWPSFSYFTCLLLLSMPAAWTAIQSYDPTKAVKKNTNTLKQLTLYSLLYLFLFACIISARFFIH